jgi:hypothetical protein
MWSFVTTVSGQAQNYTNRQVGAAQRARTMQNIIMHPGDHQLAKSAIHYLANCPVTEHDICTAHDIYGPNLGSLKGKTVHPPSQHFRAGIDPVPPDIHQRHKSTVLAIDIMFIKKLPFLVTLSRNIKFLTVEALPNRQEGTVRDKLKAVIRLYEHRGFKVNNILADPEFKMLRPYFPMLNTCGADKHVPDIVRAIRTIKDRVRSAHSRFATSQS